MLKTHQDHGYAAPPAGVDLCITDACNLRCSYCPLWGPGGLQPTPRFMDLGRGRALLHELALFRPSLRIICGESLLHPEWSSFVSSARELGMWSAVVTNGILLADHSEEIVRSGLLAIGISVDGLAHVNDATRGAGSYARVVHGICELQQTKRRLSSELPWVEIYTTIQENNHQHLVRFAEEVSSWGIHKLRLQHLIWCSPVQLERTQELLRAKDPTWQLQGDDLFYVRGTLPAVDPLVLRAELDRLTTRTWPFEIECVPNLPSEQIAAYYTDVDYRRHDSGACPTLDQYTYVGPHGNLRPCVHISMGNVFDRPFLEVWNDRPYRCFRSMIASNGRLPTCQRCPC